MRIEFELKTVLFDILAKLFRICFFFFGFFVVVNRDCIKAN